MRIKTGFARKRAHKKLLAHNRGFRMTKRRLVKVAKEAYLHAGSYAYAGRKDKKGDFRQLWITRISGALADTEINYSQFIKALEVKKIQLDRKMLAELIQDDPETFQKIVEEAKK